MFKFSILTSIILFTGSVVYGQLSFRDHYYQSNLSKYKTYKIGAFAINEQRADPDANEAIYLIQSKLHESLEQQGYWQADDPDLLVFLLLKIDTLGLELPTDAQRELMVNFTLDIRQNPGFEKVFKGTVDGLNVTNKRSEARIRKIYNKFLRNFKP